MNFILGLLLLLALLGLLGKMGLDHWQLSPKVARWAAHHGLQAPPAAEQLERIRRLVYPLDGAFGDKSPLDKYSWQNQVRHFYSGGNAALPFFVCRYSVPNPGTNHRRDCWLLLFGPVEQALPTLHIRRFSALSTPLFGDESRILIGDPAIDRRLYIRSPGDHEMAREWIMQGQRVQALLHLPHDVSLHLHAHQLSYRLRFSANVARLQKFFTGARACTTMLLDTRRG